MIDGYIKIEEISLSASVQQDLWTLNATLPFVRGLLYTGGVLYANADKLTQLEIDEIKSQVDSLINP